MSDAFTRLALAAPRPVLKAGEWWMGISLGENKLGYLRVTATPETVGTEKRLRQHTTTWMRTAVLGTTLEQRIDVEELLDADLRPLRLEVRLGSAGQWVQVKAQFHADRVDVERHAGDNVTRKMLPIPAGANLVGDVETALLNREVRLGETWRYTFLNIVTLALEEATIEAVRRETLTLDGTSYDTLVTHTQSPTMDATSWLLADGQPVKMVVAPGLTMVRQTREAALSGLEERPYDPSRDLATQTAVRLRGSITTPGQVRFLRLRVSGIPEPRFVLSDARQRARIVDQGATVTAEYTVDAEATPPATPLTAAERAQLLAPGTYLQVDHPEIVATAREAVAGATDDAAKVRALWRWVHENVRIQGDIGLPRSALEVLREPVGVCRDVATLYAALARAVGIPTRVCAGIVYFRDGFYYHAWAESHADGRWLPVDPTIAPGLVDATRIKFTEGDAATIYNTAKIIGRLEAEVLEQR